MEKVKAVIVGAGGFGYRHARALAEHPGAELVAVCGRTPEKTRRRAHEFHIRAYTDIAEMIAAEQPDLVDVVTQERDQYQAIMQVLDVGGMKAVLTEKPLGVSVREAYEMVYKAREKQVDFGVNFNRRFAAPYTLAKQWTTDREIGDLTYLSLKFSHDPYDPPTETDEYRWFFNVYPHAFDMMTHFAGPVDKISAFFLKPEDHFYYKRFTVNFQFARGRVLGNLIGGGEGKWRHESERFEAGGTNGHLVVTNVTEKASLRRHDRELESVWKPAITEGPGLDIFTETVHNHLNLVIERMLAGERLPSQAVCALYSQILAQAARKSHENGGKPAEIKQCIREYQLAGLEDMINDYYLNV